MTELSLTQAEVAQLPSCPFGTSAQKSRDLVRRNPQLKKITSIDGTRATLLSPGGVSATADAMLLAMTSAWATVPKSPERAACCGPSRPASAPVPATPRPSR